MQDSQIIEITEKAIRKVAVEQKALLETGRVERTFSTRLRDKLLPIFQTETITVDAPYSRHLKETKLLDGRLIELDMVVHEPFTNDQNIIAIEFETNNNPKEDDVWKLEGLTRNLGGYEYQLGLFIVFGVGNRAGEIIKIAWYKNGQKL